MGLLRPHKCQIQNLPLTILLPAFCPWPLRTLEPPFLHPYLPSPCPPTEQLPFLLCHILSFLSHILSFLVKWQGSCLYTTSNISLPHYLDTTSSISDDASTSCWETVIWVLYNLPITCGKLWFSFVPEKTSEAWTHTHAHALSAHTHTLYLLTLRSLTQSVNDQSRMCTMF